RSLDQIDWRAGEERQRNRRFLELARVRETIDVLLVEAASAVHRLDLDARRRIVARCTARGGADVAANLRDDVANGGCCGGVGRGKLVAHRGGGILDKLEQVLARQVMARADMHG